MKQKNKSIYGIAGQTSYVKPNNNGKIDLPSELEQFLDGISDDAKLKQLLNAIIEKIPVFTEKQLAALNSGITSDLVTKLSALPDNASLTQELSQKLENSDLADVIDTVAIADETNGDITIQYEDDEPEPQENNNNEE